MTFPSVAAFIGGESVEDSAIGGLLQVHVERGVDAQAALVDLVGTVLGFQVAADFFDEVGREGIGIVLEIELDRTSLGIGRLLAR